MTPPPESPAAPVDLGSVGIADVVRYAGASGDQNPLHFDPAFARRAGHDRLFAMGALHGAWLLSHLFATTSDEAPATGYSVTLRFKGVVHLDAPITATSAATADGVEGELLVGGRPAVSATITYGNPGDVDESAEDVQTAQFPVEVGAVDRFARAVRWPYPVGAGLPVPATAVGMVAWFLERADPMERLGFEAERTLAGGTTIHHHGRPLTAGETLTVREYVTARTTKTGSHGPMDLADLVTELHDAEGLRVTYRNTFVQLPAPDPGPDPVDPADFRLRGSHDSLTGDTYYPERELSVDGRLRPLESVELSTEGILYAHTSYDGVDYGQIDLPEGVRLQSALAPGEHSIGATYVLVSTDGKEWGFARA